MKAAAAGDSGPDLAKSLNSVLRRPNTLHLDGLRAQAGVPRQVLLEVNGALVPAIMNMSPKAATAAGYTVLQSVRPGHIDESRAHPVSDDAKPDAAPVVKTEPAKDMIMIVKSCYWMLL